MGKHRRVDSIQGATQAGPGDFENTRGHPQFGLWVEAENLDPGQDTLSVRVEGSATGQHWAPLDAGAPAVEDTLFLSEADLTESDENAAVYVGYIRSHNNPIEFVRANVADYADVSAGELTVTAYVFIGGWTGRGKKFNEREDTPTGQLGRGS